MSILTFQLCNKCFIDYISNTGVCLAHTLLCNKNQLCNSYANLCYYKLMRQYKDTVNKNLPKLYFVFTNCLIHKAENYPCIN